MCVLEGRRVETESTALWNLQQTLLSKEKFETTALGGASEKLSYREEISGLVARVSTPHLGDEAALKLSYEIWITPVSLISDLCPRSCSPSHIPECTTYLLSGGWPSSPHLSFPVLNTAAFFFPRPSVSTQQGTFWAWSLIKVLLVFHGNWRC